MIKFHNKQSSISVDFSKAFTIQGHRGARGYCPENTILSCQKAIELGADGLEIDICVSKDNQLIVSHEPWMSRHICSFPDGKPVDTEGSLFLKNMTVSNIQTYDCGMRGNARFPTQQAIKTCKPTLYELVLNIMSFCEAHHYPPPFWNIEVKSHVNWYGRLVPFPRTYAALIRDFLAQHILLLPKNRYYLSSFDPYILRAIRRELPDISLAFLTEQRENFGESIKRLGFKPHFYSPFYKNITSKMVKQVHHHGVQLVTWTVNDMKSAKRLKKWGVDGIITDFPNLLTV